MTLQLITPYSIRIGVVGAGTMGGGIALVALLADMGVTLYDVSPQMLDRAQEYIAAHLARKNKQSNIANLLLTSQLEDFTGARIVIEAIPEDIELKKGLFRQLDMICPPPAILATNTSTLSVTAIAAATNHPQRVAGIHFFNPAPVMPLIEVVRGAQTSQETMHTLLNLAEKLSKTPVTVGDTPGFIVNRVARPFYGEALRILGEGVATHEQIDLLVHLGAGFRMGPFKLMDLIGIDVNLSATQSMYEQTYGEPRYRPHPIQTRMVQRNALGQKTKQGFYRYDITPEIETKPPQPRKSTGFVLLGSGSWASGLGEIVSDAGYKVVSTISTLTPTPAIGIALSGKKEGLMNQLIEMDQMIPENVPLLCQCADVTLTEAATWIDRPWRLVGFDGLFFAGGRAISLIANPNPSQEIISAVEDFMIGLGRIPLWIKDSPGLVLPRIMCMVSNEAAFAIQEGVAEDSQIDLAMRLGANYPRGPLAWAKELGYAQVVDVLDHLRHEFGEDRYRSAYLLRRWARLQNNAST